MGTDVYMNRGIAIHTTTTVKKVRIDYTTCSDETCKNRGETLTTPFCPQCGQKVEAAYDEEDQLRDMKGFLKQYKGNISYDDPMQGEYQNDKNVWLVNIGRGSDVMSDGDVIFSMTPEFIQEQLEQVEEYKRREFEMLKALTDYGVEYTIYPQISAYVSV